MAELLNVDKAIDLILDALNPLPMTQIGLSDAWQRILAQDIIATQNVPAFDYASMDGYAIRAEDCATATPQEPTSLSVVMDITAGSTPQRALQVGETARIMTGAPIPAGANAVIPVEDTDSTWMNHPDAPLPTHVTIFRASKRGENVRLIGESVRVGDTVISAHTRLDAPEIGVLASLGYASVPVFPKPRVALLTSGDELTPLGEPLSIGKIYDANTPALSAMVRQNGGEPIPITPAKDTLDDIRRMFQEAIAQRPDMIVSTAGVSVGAADLTRTVLAELGQVGFWRINLRPGKPLAFGNINGIPFFGLPGNPVSALVTFEVLVRLALQKLASVTDNSRYVTATVAHTMHSDGRRSYVRVILEQRGDEWFASETGTQSSGVLMSFLKADGLLIIPEDVKVMEVGTRLTVKLLRDTH
jgi:molybdopterin molybdotransferase